MHVSVLGVTAVTLAACSSSPSPSPSSTASSSTATARPTTTVTSIAITTTTGTLLPQTPTITEFYAPSRNLECQIEDSGPSDSRPETLCLTDTPARSVTLGANSTLKECTGGKCLSNAGVNTPTLAYGSSITLGRFTCLSMTTGMKCTLANGNGFILASSGVTPIGSVTVIQTTSG